MMLEYDQQGETQLRNLFNGDTFFYNGCYYIKSDYYDSNENRLCVSIVTGHTLFLIATTDVIPVKIVAKLGRQDNDTNNQYRNADVRKKMAN